MVALQRELTAIPALGPRNGGQGENAKAFFLEKQLKALSPETLFNYCLSGPAGPGGISLQSPGPFSRGANFQDHLDLESYGYCPHRGQEVMEKRSL